jgi:DNA-directed RNA polymerase sigma subunit (sigma70/sigma32)
MTDEPDVTDDQIIRYRFGLDRDGIPRPLLEVVSHFGVEEERVKRAAAKYLSKMRHPQTGAYSD